MVPIPLVLVVLLVLVPVPVPVLVLAPVPLPLSCPLTWLLYHLAPPYKGNLFLSKQTIYFSNFLDSTGDEPLGPGRIPRDPPSRVEKAGEIKCVLFL